VRPENISITADESKGGHRLQANLRQRIFAGAMGTCLLDWQGQTLKVIARDQDLPNLSGSGPVWLDWDADK